MADVVNGRRQVILATGGTIAGRAARAGDNLGYVAGVVHIEDMLRSVPSLADWPLELEQVAQIDSKDMDFSVWKKLASRVAHHLAREDVDGVVITHGTDTLEETAYFLQEVLKPRKPVVLTCAMRPATALVPDGPQNLLDAVAVAGSGAVQGVVAVCAGLIHSAQHVAKTHSYRLDAFDSGDAGPLGCVEEGQTRLFQSMAPRSGGPEFDEHCLQSVMQAGGWPRVEWITSHANADGSQVLAMLAYGRADPTRMPRGFVVAGTGNGTLHRSLESALLLAKEAGVRVVRATRCARGRVIPCGASAFPDSAGLSPAKAQVALAIELLGL